MCAFVYFECSNRGSLMVESHTVLSVVLQIYAELSVLSPTFFEYFLLVSRVSIL